MTPTAYVPVPRPGDVDCAHSATRRSEATTVAGAESGGEVPMMGVAALTGLCGLRVEFTDTPFIPHCHLTSSLIITIIPATVSAVILWAAGPLCRRVGAGLAATGVRRVRLASCPPLRATGWPRGRQGTPTRTEQAAIALLLTGAAIGVPHALGDVRRACPPQQSHPRPGGPSVPRGMAPPGGRPCEPLARNIMPPPRNTDTTPANRANGNRCRWAPCSVVAASQTTSHAVSRKHHATGYDRGFT